MGNNMKKILSLIIFLILLSLNSGTIVISVEEITEYDLVIITPKCFISDLQPLVEHKESHGIKTIIQDTGI